MSSRRNVNYRTIYKYCSTRIVGFISCRYAVMSFKDVPRTCPKWSSGVLGEFEEARAGRSPSSSCLCPRWPAAALSEWLEPAIIKYRKHQYDLSFYHRHHIDEIYTNIVFTDNICCFIIVIIRILSWHWECWSECGGLPWVSSVPARCLHYQQISETVRLRWKLKKTNCIFFRFWV